MFNSTFSELMMTNYYLNNESKSIQRLEVFDFARGLAVLFMVLVHVLGLFASPKVYNSTFGSVIDFLGSPPAAPVFMFTMGVFFMLSSKADSLSFGLKRGLKLFLLGLLLSFLRTDLLNILEGYFTADFLWEIDILQFAGIAYILMSLIRHYFKKPIIWLIIACSIMLVSPYLWGIDSPNILISWFIHYLWGNGELVYFPVFGWLYYPLMGMIFGVFLKKSKTPERAFKDIRIPSITLLALGSLISLTNMDFHIGDYFRGGQGSMVWILGFICVWLVAIDHYLSDRQNNRWTQYIYYCGKQTTVIYFVHWLLISWVTPFIGFEQYGFLATISLMTVTLILTHHISKYILNKKRASIL